MSEEDQVKMALNALTVMIKLAEIADNEEAEEIIERVKLEICQATKTLGHSVSGSSLKTQIGDDGEVSIVPVENV